MFMNDLQHHGIKGQRWGVRRTPKQLARVRRQNTASKVKRTTRRVARTVGLSIVTTAAVKTLLDNTNAISLGRKFVNRNSYKTLNQLSTNKSWADYAWEEVNKF